MAITSFAQLKAFIDNVLLRNGESGGVGHSPHRAFWDDLTYDQFVNGNTPNVDPPVKILVAGNSAQSNIIMALRGSGPLFDPNTGAYGQMPANGPPYFTNEQVDEIAAWIDNGCPQ
jgi:hypothetical protein